MTLFVEQKVEVLKRQVCLLKVRVGYRVIFNHYKQRITLLTEAQKQGHNPMHVVEGIRITPSWGKIAMLFFNATM